MSSSKDGGPGIYLSPKRKLRSLDSRYLIHVLPQNGKTHKESLLPCPIKRPRRRATYLKTNYNGKILDDEECCGSNGLSQDIISCDDVDGDVTVLHTCDLSPSNGCLSDRPSSLELIAPSKVAFMPDSNGVADPLSTAANNHINNDIPWLSPGVGRHKLPTVQSTPSMQPGSPGSGGSTIPSSAICSSSPASPLVAHSSSGDGSSSAVSSPSISCNWDGCTWSQSLASPEDLHDHMLSHHVTPQSLSKRRKYFMCLWSECRLYKVSSLSYSWLERHVLEHSGAQPYVCIFYPACRQRLATQVLLERHVQRVHLSCDVDNGQQNSVSNSTNLISLSSPLSNHNLPSSPPYSNQLNSNNSTCRKVLPSLIRKRRRRRIKPYRVHSIDFLDGRSRQNIQDFNQMYAIDPSRVFQSTFMSLRAFPHMIVCRRVIHVNGESKVELLVRFLSDRTSIEKWISEEDYRSVSDTCSH